MLKVIFIGGSGRSGTNILRKVFDRHSKAATLDFEYRFIIDPDGIIDFYNSYSSTWSPYMADVKIKRLEKLLNNVASDGFVSKMSMTLKGVITPKKYAGWELEKHIPGFKKFSKELIDELRSFTYPGIWPGTESYELSPKMYYGEPKTKEELAKIFNTFLSKIFKSIIGEKDFFVEDNTWNSLFAKELLEIYPEGKLINVYRDPRDVIASFTKQRWCPRNTNDAVKYYKGIMKKWFSVKDNVSCFDLKFEDFVNNPRESIKNICDFCGIDFEEKMVDMDFKKSAHIGRWKSENMQIDSELEEIIKKLGYE